MEEAGLPAQLLASLVGLDKPLASLGLTIAFVEGEITRPSILHGKTILNAIPANMCLALITGPAPPERLDTLSHWPSHPLMADTGRCVAICISPTRKPKFRDELACLRPHGYEWMSWDLSKSSLTFPHPR